MSAPRKKVRLAFDWRQGRSHPFSTQRHTVERCMPRSLAVATTPYRLLGSTIGFVCVTISLFLIYTCYSYYSGGSIGLCFVLPIHRQFESWGYSPHSLNLFNGEIQSFSRLQVNNRTSHRFMCCNWLHRSIFFSNFAAKLMRKSQIWKLNNIHSTLTCNQMQPNAFIWHRKRHQMNVNEWKL